MKVYVTRDALRGVVEVEAALATASGGVAVLADGTVLQGHEWRATLEEAEAEFERQKVERLTELAGRFEKVEAMRMKVAKARPKAKASSGQTEGWAGVMRGTKDRVSAGGPLCPRGRGEA